MRVLVLPAVRQTTILLYIHFNKTMHSQKLQPYCHYEAVFSSNILFLRPLALLVEEVLTALPPASLEMGL